MNETLNIILNRRSIRKYLDKKIEKPDLDSIVEAAIMAPSAMNSQDWHFCVISNRERINEINNIIKEEIINEGKKFIVDKINEAGGDVFRGAPVLVIVSSKETEKSNIMSCAAATQNMVIAAEALNINSCWIGSISVLGQSSQFDNLRTKLQIPDGFIPNNGLVLGYKADGDFPMPERKSETVTFIS
ncbi:MAG: nitroreductase family protein [Spirochaetales bacterium]|nr:nitroreductase family protein [Spirochaetales bacterium]